MLNPSDIRFLVVHCSDSPNDNHITARDIHQLHLGFGWDGLGYHQVILRNGTVEKGRPEFWLGAHVKGHNHESLGVCLIGRDDFTLEQFDALETLLNIWKTEYPDAKIIGHCDFEEVEKTCPNFNVQSW